MLSIPPPPPLKKSCCSFFWTRSPFHRQFMPSPSQAWLPALPGWWPVRQGSSCSSC
jgi:hypothetical protein